VQTGSIGATLKTIALAASEISDEEFALWLRENSMSKGA
jgi:hypothetical protein